MTTPFYEVTLTPGVKLAQRRFFRPWECPACGRRLAQQMDDLALATEPEVTGLPAVVVSPGGHLIVQKTVDSIVWG